MSYKLLLISVAFLSLSLGCRENGPTNYKLSGAITFKGEPVSNGEVYLRPVGDGPGGFALIKDGKYETIDGKGYLSGLSKITFHGGDGLFPPITIELDLPAEDFVYDIEVTDKGL